MYLVVKEILRNFYTERQNRVSLIGEWLSGLRLEKNA